MSDWTGPFPKSDRKTDKYMPAEAQLNNRGTDTERKASEQTLAPLQQVCGYCGSIFGTREQLRAHKLTRHASHVQSFPPEPVPTAIILNEKSARCRLCGTVVLNSPEVLKRHISERHDDPFDIFEFPNPKKNP